MDVLWKESFFCLRFKLHCVGLHMDLQWIGESLERQLSRWVAFSAVFHFTKWCHSLLGLKAPYKVAELTFVSGP